MRILLISGNGDLAGLRRTLFWSRCHFDNIEYFSANVEGVVDVFREFHVCFDWRITKTDTAYPEPTILGCSTDTIAYMQAEGTIAVDGCYDRLEEKAVELKRPVDALPLLLTDPPLNCSWGDYWQEAHPGVISRLLQKPLVLKNSQFVLRASLVTQYTEVPVPIVEEAAAVITDCVDHAMSPAFTYTFFTSKSKELCLP